MFGDSAKTKFKRMLWNANRKQPIQEEHFWRSKEESLDWSRTHLGSKNHDLRWTDFGFGLAQCFDNYEIALITCEKGKKAHHYNNSPAKHSHVPKDGPTLCAEEGWVCLWWTCLQYRWLNVKTQNKHQLQNESCWLFYAWTFIIQGNAGA